MYNVDEKIQFARYVANQHGISSVQELQVAAGEFISENGQRQMSAVELTESFLNPSNTPRCF